MSPENGVMRSFMSGAEAESEIILEEAAGSDLLFELTKSTYSHEKGDWVLEADGRHYTRAEFAAVYDEVINENPLPGDMVASVESVHGVIEQITGALQEGTDRRRIFGSYVMQSEIKLIEAWSRAEVA